jgi:polar amino acid transport system substrate-binding protein
MEPVFDARGFAKAGLSAALITFMLAAMPAPGHAEDACKSIVMTGHPDYPIIAYRDGDAIAGAAPMLVEEIGKQLGVPVESKYMGNWQAAQDAVRSGKADMIVGVYYNQDRAAFLDYVQPAFIYDQTVVFAAKDKPFTYKSSDDLIGKKGLANEGESFGDKFDSFMKEKLDVKRVDGLDDALEDLVEGKADYVIAGYYPGTAEAGREGIGKRIVALSPVIINAEMFVAFSKKSPCAGLAAKFGDGITKLTTDGSFSAMMQKATADWRATKD